MELGYIEPQQNYAKIISCSLQLWKQQSDLMSSQNDKSRSSILNS